MKKPLLTLDDLRKEAATFGKAESGHSEPTLFGVTDGKAVGTYLEQKFRFYLPYSLQQSAIIGHQSLIELKWSDLISDR